jgi:regulator of sigma E protease
MGFKTGDKIISVDGTKIKKFDNDINMKVVLGKDPYRKKRNPGP